MRVASCALAILLSLSLTEALTTTRTNLAFTSPAINNAASLPFCSSSRISETSLYAKKGKKNKAGAANAKLAALEALEALEAAEPAAPDLSASNGAAPAAAAVDPLAMLQDEPLSKKEQMALEKKMQKEAKKQQKAAQAAQAAAQEAETAKANKKARALAALAEMERMEADSAAPAAAPANAGGGKPMSKKEAKLAARAAAKQEEKMAAKLAKKAAKQAAAANEGDAALDEVNGAAPGVVGEEVNGAAPANGEAAAPAPKKKLTLEDRIRKERPPPRVRVMESAQPNFSSLRLENVGITFRDQEVLKDVTWGVQTGDRIGLVGANGAGKTTQLRIMAGEMEPTTGDVVKSSKDLRVAVLRQEFVEELVLDRTLKEEFMSVFTEENKILMDLRAAEQKLETMDATDADAMQSVLDEMQQLQQKADAKDVNALSSRADKIMDLMGFTPEEGDDLVASFSGGWKMRIGLGKVLLKDPNILLLDEPTNHLDLESVEWLEEFLRNQNIPMVIVSHDREFLDQVCSKIVDAEGGICNEYDGNYSRFLTLKKARMDSWNAAWKAQEKKIQEEKKWINKFKVKQPQAVKQRQAKLEKMMKSEDYVQKPPFFGKPFRFRFPDAPRLSPEVAEVKGLSHSYGDGSNHLFDDCSLFIEKNDRIAVLGPNGSGKSTLLRILMGKEEPDEGSAEIIGQNVVANYFEQNQADALDLSCTVVDTVQRASNGQSYNELRALLGQFLFKGDAVEKKVENLSGGEKARLSLCCMMLRPANLLILDEPTNHLDIPAKEMLEEALQHFQGSVVVISHDRYFISKVATTIVAIEDKKLEKYTGDYKFYMDRSSKVKEKIEARYVKGVDRIGSAPVIDLEEIVKPKKNFGGAKGANMVTRKNKGVKNAKRQERK
mmetsp:Transcript_38815/g.56649  ORF Transcript_38815/g.56649 Transcript_38815/m.56649 type:complete len:892 (+) Transcript_38815:143-2818(+)